MRQITKAMKMVSASKLRRAQDRVLAARPFAESIQRMLANIAQSINEGDDASQHPLLAARPEKKILLLLITADRGLAGAFNSNLIRAAQRFLVEHKDSTVELKLMGRKGRDFFRKRHKHISGEYSTLFQKVVRYEDALEIARKVIERFSKAEVDAVYLIYNGFRSVVAANLTVVRILPVEPPKEEQHIDYIYEEPPQELLAGLLPRYIENQIFRAMLESAAAEHAARMTAMEAASSNASDVLDKLTLNMNRVRQAGITREIIEIVSGAAALD